MENLGPLDEAPAYLIYRLSRLLRQNLKQVLKAENLDVTAEQYFLLYKLFLKDGVAQSELADSVLGDYPNITRHIDSLEKKELVERNADPSDRRKYLIRLTDLGRQQMEKAVPVIKSERKRLFGEIKDEQMSQFYDMVMQLQAKLI